VNARARLALGLLTLATACAAAVAGASPRISSGIATFSSASNSPSR